MWHLFFSISKIFQQWEDWLNVKEWKTYGRTELFCWFVYLFFSDVKTTAIGMFFFIGFLPFSPVKVMLRWNSEMGNKKITRGFIDTVWGADALFSRGTRVKKGLGTTISTNIFAQNNKSAGASEKALLRYYCVVSFKIYLLKKVTVKVTHLAGAVCGIWFFSLLSNNRWITE